MKTLKEMSIRALEELLEEIKDIIFNTRQDEYDIIQELQIRKDNLKKKQLDQLIGRCE